jgi:cysteine desulfurase/selenocysteine lyase
MAIAAPLDAAKVREDFPILVLRPNGRRLAYLDNGATSQKPIQVLDALDRYWREQNANIHRGVHYLSQLATERYEVSRKAAQRFLKAAQPEEVIFTHGCTEGINMVASGLSHSAGSKASNGKGGAWIQQSDEILVSVMEHHANIVPWQIAAEHAGAIIRTIPMTDAGEIDLDAYRSLLASGRVKIVAITHVSNAIGTINPLKEMIEWAHAAGARVVADGAQAGPHLRIDVRDLDVDYYVLSCHKMYAPTGVGVLYGKRALLKELPPFQGGGDMVKTVSLTRGTTYADLPSRLEAGTPNIAGAIGVGAAIEYIEGLAGSLDTSFAWIQEQESKLAAYATEVLSSFTGLTIHGAAKHRSAILSFTLEGAHPHDIGTILDGEGVAVRTGHHCCMPLMERLGVPATARASISFYNNREDIDQLATGIRKVQELFGK